MEDVWYLFPVLFLTGILAGLVDSIAGGGGLITLPVLMSFGLNPMDSLGTNKFQACFGSGSATWNFAKNGWVRWDESQWAVLCTAIGACLGTMIVVRIHPDFLKQLVIVMLIACLIYNLVRPRLGMEERKSRMGPVAFAVLFGLGLGFYDGFFGPGTGSFWAMAYMLGLGLTLDRATGRTKAVNFTSNIISMGVFAFSGHIRMNWGFTMGMGQLIGARIGSGLVMKKGSRFVRPIFLSAVALLILKLIYTTYIDRR